MEVEVVEVAMRFRTKEERDEYRRSFFAPPVELRQEDQEGEEQGGGNG